MDAHDLASLDATAQAELIRRGEVHPKEVVEAAIGRLEALDPVLNATVFRDFDPLSAPQHWSDPNRVVLVVKDGAVVKDTRT